MQNLASEAGELEARSTPRALTGALRRHGLLLAAAMAVFLFGEAMAVVTGYSVRLSLLIFLQNYVVMAGLIVLCGMLVWKAGRMLLVERPASPLREVARWVRRDVVTAERLLNGTFGMLVLLLLVAGFTQAKNVATRLPGYNWDEALMRLDRALHFGALPQDLLWPLLGTPLATHVIDLAYALWYAMFFAACFVGAFLVAPSLARHRFLLALIFILGIGGSVLAIALSSVGPAYFSHVVAGPDPYAAHMARLGALDAASPLHALQTQQMLWQAKARGDASLVSAMPSMHVAFAALVAMALWGCGGLLRAASLAFAGLILLGSVHLGWHYAVDSYAGILIAAAAWIAARPLSRWYLALVGEDARP